MKPIFFIILAAVTLAANAQQMALREATASEIAAGTIGFPAVVTPRRNMIATNTVYATKLGFKFDGSDEYAKLQAILDTASSSNSLYFKQDSLKPITLRGHVVVRGNTTIEGMGKHVTAFFCASNYNDLFFTGDLDGNSVKSGNITIKNCRIDFNGKGQALRPNLTTNSVYWAQLTNWDGSIWNVQGDGKTGILNLGFWWNSVTNLTVENVSIYDAPSFSVTLGPLAYNVRLLNVETEQIEPLRHNSDGYHLLSPIVGLTMRDCKGIGGSDDSIAFNTDEFRTTAMHWTNGCVWPGCGNTYGNSGDILIENYRDVSGYCFGVRFLSYVDDGYNWITNLTLRNITINPRTNTTQIGIIHAMSSSVPSYAQLVPLYVPNLRLENIKGEGTASLIMQNLSAETITVDGFETHSPPAKNTGGAGASAYVVTRSPVKNLVLRNFNIVVPAETPTNSYLVNNNYALTNVQITGLNMSCQTTNLRYLFRHELAGLTGTRIGTVDNSIYPKTVGVFTNDPIYLSTGTRFSFFGDSLNYSPSVPLVNVGASPYTTFPSVGTPLMPGYAASYNASFCADLSALTNDAILFGRTNLWVQIPVISTIQITAVGNQQTQFGFFTNSASGNGAYTLFATPTSNFVYSAIAPTNWFTLNYSIAVPLTLWTNLYPGSYFHFATYNGSTTNLWMGSPTITVY